MDAAWAVQIAHRARLKRFDGSAAQERRQRSYGLSSLEPSLTLADGRRTWVLGARLEGERAQLVGGAPQGQDVRHRRRPQPGRVSRRHRAGARRQRPGRPVARPAGGVGGLAD